MSKLKINENLFLGKQELNRFQNFLDEDGFRKIIGLVTGVFGIVKTSDDINFNALRISQGTTPTKLNLASGNAIDKNSQVITVLENQNDLLYVPPDGEQYKVVIKYATKNTEKGLVNISPSGQLTGFQGAEFLKVLRGIPHHYVKIRFPNSAQNTQEYVVNVVNSDTSATIQGASFIQEFSQEYIVIGSFTPGALIPSDNKQIYLYDHFSALVVPDSYVLTEGIEFLLAKVSSDGTTLTISDQRYFSIYSLNQTLLPDALENSNPIAGLEWLQNDSAFSDKEYNVARLGWGVRSNNGAWVATPAFNQIDISSALGGTMLDISTFIDNSFNGWRVYFNNGKYRKISSSLLISGQLRLIIEDYNVNLIPINGAISIVPNADFIHVFSDNVLQSGPGHNSQVFPIVKGFGDLRVKASGSSVFASFRYEMDGVVSGIISLNDGDYYNVTAFNDLGLQINSNTSSVSGGVFNSPLSDRSFFLKKAWIDADNLFTAKNKFSDLYLKTDIIPVDIPYVTLNASKSSIRLLLSNNTQLIEGFASGSDARVLFVQNDVDSNGLVKLANQSVNTPSSDKILTKDGGFVYIGPGRGILFIYIEGSGWIQI